MAQKQDIKHLYEEKGKSLREISRIMDLSFQTVKKYAYEDNWNQDHLPNVEPSHHPLPGPYIEVIDRWLEEDRHAPRKQRHTVSRTHARLLDEHGFSGKSIPCVKKYVRKAHLLLTQGKERKGALLLSEIVGDGNAKLCDDTLVVTDECGRTDADSLRQWPLLHCLGRETKLLTQSYAQALQTEYRRRCRRMSELRRPKPSTSSFRFLFLS